MSEASNDALRALHTKIREQMNTYADTLAGGGIPDFSEYKRLTGIIEGFALVERDLLDLDEKIEQA